jgi:predicted MFS family arabinose efflux permease
MIVGAIYVIANIHRTAGGVIALELGAARAMAASDIGFIIGVMPMASAMVQVPTGMLLDRWGVRRTLSAMLVLASVGSAWLAFADGSFGLSAARALIGVGFAASMTSIYLVAIGWAGQRRMAMFSGTVIALAGSIGAVLATTPLALAFQGFGWNVTFALIAAITVVGAVSVHRFVADGPGGPVARAPETFGESVRALGEMARHRDLRRGFVMAFCFAGPFMTIGGLWVGPYLRDLYGMDDTTASAIIMAMVLAHSGGALVYGVLDRLFNSRTWLVVGGVGVTIATYGYFIVDLTPPLHLAVALLVVGSLACPFSIVLTAQCRSFVPASRVGRMVTMMALVGITGIFAMQAASGMVIDAFGAATPDATRAGYRMVFAIPVSLLFLCSLIYAPISDAASHDHAPSD